MSCLYPEIEPYRSDYLKVSDLHTIYYEEAGNPAGKPVVFLLGGPGGGLMPFYRQYFDPEFYRIILFDQRGCGKSTPHAELRENTTWDLVEDMEKLRNSLGIEKWLVFGGSWGSTLALSYAVTHPEKVVGLILRGIFLGRKFEFDWLYRDGVSNLYPREWEDFVSLIPKTERNNMIDAYYSRLINGTESSRLEAARRWSVWEGNISKLIPDQKVINEFDDPHMALSIARLECHYFVNNLFFEYDGYLLDRTRKITHIPCIVAQGRYDIVCPVKSAWDLKHNMPDVDLRIVPNAGHSITEPGITEELVNATNEFKKLFD